MDVRQERQGPDDKATSIHADAAVDTGTRVRHEYTQQQYAKLGVCSLVCIGNEHE